MYVSGAIAKSTWEQSQSLYLQKQYSYQTSKTSISNMDIQTSHLQQNIMDIELNYIQEKNRLETELRQTFEILKSNLKIWEQNYILKTPIAGTITFTKIWSKNQNIFAGDIAFRIVTDRQTKIIGKLQLPVQGAGKVKAGQTVNIKFNNYPYMEYGMVQGKIESISLVPTENFYLVQVNLANTLITNYGKELMFSQEMSGTAEIITEDLSLLSRLFNPIRYILKKRT